RREAVPGAELRSPHLPVRGWGGSSGERPPSHATLGRVGDVPPGVPAGLRGRPRRRPSPQRQQPAVGRPQRRLGRTPPAARPGPGGAAAGFRVPQGAPGYEPPPPGFRQNPLDHQGQPLPESPRAPIQEVEGSGRSERSGSPPGAGLAAAPARALPEGQRQGHAGAQATAARAARRLSPSDRRSRAAGGMIRLAGAPARGDPAGPLPDVGKGEGEEEEEEDGGPPCPPAAPKNCLPRRGISVLEKLIKTCPVWLQLGLGRAEAARILHQEVAGTFLVRRDSSSKQLVLCVHFPSPNESSSEVLEYTIKEEKSNHEHSKYLPRNEHIMKMSWLESQSDPAFQTRMVTGSSLNNNSRCQLKRV
uniref:Ras and Rab interactor 3 n=1 Tax=Equus caballus TaxID=9796 RepID=A0A9L0RH12_HORSE